MEKNVEGELDLPMNENELALPKSSAVGGMWVGPRLPIEVLGFQTGSWASRMAFGRLRGLGCRN